MTGDFCLDIVSMELESGDFDHLFLYDTRLYTGTALSSRMAVVERKYVYEDGSDVLIEIDDDLVS